MDVKDIQEAYRRRLQNDSQINQIRKKVADGDLAALQKYSMRAGKLSVDLLQESFSDGDQNDIKQALEAVFQANYQAVANASQAAQKAANQAAGLGIQASVSDYEDIADDIANKLAGYEDVREGLDKVAKDIVLQSQKYADDSERKSASFANDSGLEVLVSREYDDVGVHTTDKGGGQPCQWCLDRCGTDVPYQEAYDRGMFERHPGCGCIITYKTKRGIFRQGKGDWEHNQWAEVKGREQRIRNNNRDPEQIMKKWNVTDVKHEYLQNADAGIGSIRSDNGYQYETHKDEQNVSKWLLKNFGGNIVLLNESKTDGVHTADYYWDGKLWDLKSPEGNGKRTIDNQFKTIAKQIADAPGGMILDCTKLKFSNDEILSMVSKRISLNDFNGDVIIKRKGAIVSVLRKIKG